jgi:hypothetical protein
MVIASFAASLVTQFLIKKGKEYIEKNFTNKDKFQEELTGVINETMGQFQKTYPPSKGERIAFYESEEVLEALLNYSFFSDYDFSNLAKFIKFKENFLPTSQESLTDFFELFRSNIQKNVLLKKLEIEFRYKENIAKILELINQLNDSLQKTLRDIDDSLKGEYNRQLNEIRDTIRAFQAKTALERLDSLNQTILDKGYMTDSIQARIYYLQGLCYEDIDLQPDRKNELFIKAYKNNSSDPEYKIRAALGYLSFKEQEKAEQLVNEILERDEFNSVGWLMKFIMSSLPFSEKLNSIPQKVITGKTFIPMLFNWLLVNHLDEEAKIIEREFLPKSILEPPIPETISYETKDYWFLITLINIYAYYHESSLTYYFIDKTAISKNLRLNYLNSALHLISQTFEHTEIRVRFNSQLFYKNYLDFIFNKQNFSLKSLETSYKNLSHPVTANLMALTQVLVTLGETDKALEYVTNFEASDPFDQRYKTIAKCVLYRLKKDAIEALNSLKEYVESVESIDELVLANILLCTNGVFSSKDQVNSFKEQVVKNAIFNNKSFLLLFNVYLETTFLNELPKLQVEESLHRLKEDTSIDIGLKHFVALSLTNSGRFGDAIGYLNTFINKESPDSDLYLYINCLIEYEESDKIELLKLLKWWRINVGLNFKFLSAEMYYRQYIEDWSEIEEITAIGRREFKEEQGFIALELIALERQNKSEKIKAILPELRKTDFRQERDAINAFVILSKYHFFEDALEILYKSAVKKENKISRQAYLTNRLSSADSLFREFNKVEIGAFVKYEIEGNKNCLHISSDGKNEHLTASFIGKEAGEEFFVPEPVGHDFKKVQVIRIMNKYLALYEEIAEDAEDPYSGIKMKKIKTDPGNIKEFEKSLIENFGPDGSLRKQFVEEQLKKYYNGIISFTEISTSIFRGEFFDAYTFLTSKESEGFLTLPPILALGNAANHSSNFLLDMSSVVLFYELFKDLQIKPERKFYVSPFLVRQIKDRLADLELSRPSSMSLSITVEGIRPYFFSDDFHRKKIDFLSGLLNWLEGYSEPLIIEKRVSLNAHLDKDQIDEKFQVRIVIDNALGLENNYILISSDFFYHRQMPQFRKNIIPPQHYLTAILGTDAKLITEYLLQKKYVGLDLSNDIIMDEFNKSQAMKENYYHYCLLNISFYFNPNSSIVGTAIRFLKSVYLTTWATEEDRKAVSLRVFLNLLKGVSKNEEFIRLVRLVITHEFRLMGIHQFIILNEFDKAVQILKGK